MADTTFINRVTTTDTAKHLTVIATRTLTKHHTPKDYSKFYSLEFWLPFLVTLFIFAAGQFAVSYFKRTDKRSQLRNAKTNLETWIIQLEVTAKELAKNCRSFSLSLRLEKAIQRVSLNYTPTLINKISELNVTEFLNYSTLNLKGNTQDNSKRAFDIIQEIEFLKVCEADIKEQYKVFTDNADKLIARIGAASKLLLKQQITLNIQAAKNTTHPAHKFLQNVGQHLAAWHTSGNTQHDILIYENKFLQPYNQIVQQEINANPANLLASEFLDSLNEIQEVIINWKVVQAGFSQLMDDYANDYESTYEKLKSNTIELRTAQLVFWWWQIK